MRGNKSTIALTELGDEVRGANIDQLIHRYSTTGQNNTRVVPDDVRKVFAEYPNVINEIINLSLSNGATLDEGEQVVNLPNEFIEQFKTGQAKEIDTAICAKTDGCNEARWFSLTTRNVNDATRFRALSTSCGAWIRTTNLSVSSMYSMTLPTSMAARVMRAVRRW